MARESEPYRVLVFTYMANSQNFHQRGNFLAAPLQHHASKDTLCARKVSLEIHVLVRNKDYPRKKYIYKMYIRVTLIYAKLSKEHCKMCIIKKKKANKV